MGAEEYIISGLTVHTDVGRKYNLVGLVEGFSTSTILGYCVSVLFQNYLVLFHPFMENVITVT